MKLGLEGLEGRLFPVPGALVHWMAGKQSASWARRNARLTELQATVRILAVQHLPDSTKPLTAAALAELGGLKEADVVEALVELHRLLGFIALDSDGAVEWAYPVTVDATPHYLSFESGERMNAA
jgi:hypothetical protein